MQTLRNDLYTPWFVGDTDWGVEIIDGEFSGIVIKINSIEFSKTENEGVDVDYYIIKHPEDMQGVEKSDLFIRTIELIINDILKEAVAIHEQTRSNDSSESSQQ